MSRLLCLAASVLLIVGPAVQAGSVVQTFSFSGTPEYDTTFTVNKFNSSLGTLQDVQVSATASLDVAGTLSNGSKKSQTFTFSSDSLFSVGDFSTSSLTPDPAVSLSQVVAAKSSAPFSLSGSDSQSTTFTSAPDLAFFTGKGGTFDVDASTFTATSYSPKSISFGSTTAAISLTVTYDYVAAHVNPAPEPTSLGLLGIGSLGLWLYRRRSLR